MDSMIHETVCLTIDATIHKTPYLITNNTIHKHICLISCLKLYIGKAIH